jgi:apolipoprotein N-acyltransferase
MRPYVLAAASGLLLFLVYPNILGLEFPLLGWIVLVPLLLAIDQANTTRRAAKIAAFSGIAGYPLFYHWLVYTMNTYGQMSKPVSVLVLLALVLLLSCFLAGFGAAYHLLVKRLRVTPILAAPMVWAAFEYLRAHFPFGGFPWALMAYSQHKSLALIQIAEFTGPYGVSFMVVLANAAVAITIKNLIGQEAVKEGARAPSPAQKLRMLTPLAYGIGVPLLAVVYGLVRIPMVDRAFQDQPGIKVGIVQANVDQGIKWSSEFFWTTLQDHLDLTGALEKDGPGLVMWPEASVTVSDFNQHWARRSIVINYLASVNRYFLTGALSKDPCGVNKDGEQIYCHYNSAYLLSPRAENMLGRYDKMRLVPFSEYVPMQKLFFFADAIAQGNTGATTPGDKVVVFGMPGAHFGCVICYEVIFPHIVRRFVDQGARFMTTITNDAWFGKTGAPFQHHQAVPFRSIENRVFFARSANTGISSITDPVGRVLHQTPIYEKASFTASIKPSPITTFYTRWGDLFAWLNLIAAITALGYALKRKSTSQ